MIRTSGPQHLDSWTSPPSSAMEWRPSWKTRLLSVLLYEEGGVIKNYNFNFNWNYYYYRGRGSPFSFTFINSCCILPCSLYTHRERDCYRDRGLSGERPLLSFLFSFLLLTHTYSHTHTHSSIQSKPRVRWNFTFYLVPLYYLGVLIRYL